MRRDVLELRQFYATDLGQAARAMVERKLLGAWDDAHGLDLLALGYATPFIGPFRDRARRVVAAMPAQQGVEVWPADDRNLATLTPEDSLPFQNALFDRVLAVHVLEESADPVAYLREVWRVLSPSGRAIIAVASRNGLWANTERTPFGHGRPYSRSQLAELLREAELEPSGWTRALYVPPVPWMGGWAGGVGGMKLIIAVIKPSRLDAVLDAVTEAGASGLTVTEVRGYGRQRGKTEVYRGAEYEVKLLPKVKLEIAVPDDIAGAVVEAVKST